MNKIIIVASFCLFGISIATAQSTTLSNGVKITSKNNYHPTIEEEIKVIQAKLKSLKLDPNVSESAIAKTSKHLDRKKKRKKEIDEKRQKVRAKN